MAEQEVLDVNPEELTERECITFSSNPELKRRYEAKWNVKSVCDN